MFDEKRKNLRLSGNLGLYLNSERSWRGFNFTNPCQCKLNVECWLSGKVEFKSETRASLPEAADLISSTSELSRSNLHLQPVNKHA
jgi:hypothetical protein